MNEVAFLGDLKSQWYIEVYNGKVVEISESFIEATQYSINEFLGKSFEELIRKLRVGPKSNLEQLEKNVNYFFFTKSFEVRFIKIQLLEVKDNKTYIIREKCNSSLDDKFIFANKLAEDNHFGIGIFALPDVILLKSNEKFLNFFDEPYNKKENCLGKSVSEFVTGFIGSASEKIWQKIIDTGETYNIDEYMYDRFNRGVTYWKSTLTPIHEDGKLRYCIEMTTDITEQVMHRKKIEEQSRVIEEQKRALEKALEMKDEFLSIISHEFRTPLNVISAAIQAMNYICSNELSEKATRYVDIIKKNNLRQLRLVNNLLDITRVNAGTIKVYKRNLDIVSLTRSIVESVQLYAKQKEIKLSFNYFLASKVTAVDAEKYERILLNLLSNAIKFTPKGKTIDVCLEFIKKSVKIQVKDTGIGIPKDKIDLIFERFWQVDSSLSRKAEGIGIGLSLVKNFVIALGGTIKVKSSIGKGTIFTITIPDEKKLEEKEEIERSELLDNRVTDVTAVEFSDIYF